MRDIPARIATAPRGAVIAARIAIAALLVVLVVAIGGRGMDPGALLSAVAIAISFAFLATSAVAWGAAEASRAAQRRAGERDAAAESQESSRNLHYVFDLPTLPPSASLRNRQLLGRRDQLRNRTAQQRTVLNGRPLTRRYEEMGQVQKDAERTGAVALFFLVAALVALPANVSIITGALVGAIIAGGGYIAALATRRRRGLARTGLTPYASWGRVGGNLLDGNSDFDERNILYGVAGENRTAELLDDFLGGLTNVRVFHSLRYPGSRNADVDHVVLYGDGTFIVVDSKAWKGGAYRQTSDANVFLEDGSMRTSHMPDAVQKYQEIGYRGARALTVLHTAGKAITVQDIGRGQVTGQHVFVTDIDLISQLLGIAEMQPERLSGDQEAKFEAVTRSLLHQMV